MNEIIPYRLIIDLNSDGTFKNGILQYQIKYNGIMPNKFFTMGINNGIDLPAINTQLQKVKKHVEKGEKITKEKKV